MDPCKGGIDFPALDLSKLWTTPPAKIELLGLAALNFNTLKLSYMLYLTKMRATYVINYTRVQFELRLLLLVYACVHAYIVLQQPIIGNKVCNKDFAARVKIQGIPKHIEAATHEIPWYMCIYATPCLSMFCLSLAVLSSQLRASSCYIMILYITRSHMRHEHKNSHVDLQICMKCKLCKTSILTLQT